MCSVLSSAVLLKAINVKVKLQYLYQKALPKEFKILYKY